MNHSDDDSDDDVLSRCHFLGHTSFSKPKLSILSFVRLYINWAAKASYEVRKSLGHIDIGRAHFSTSMFKQREDDELSATEEMWVM